MVKVLADKYLYKLGSFIPEGVDLQLYDPGIAWEIPEDCNALLVRTVSPVNSRTLPEVPAALKFVATGSSGTDHIDIDYLRKNGISTHDAKGCNARAVAEYVMTALLLWSENTQKELTDQTIGIIGCGFTGNALSELFDSFGLHYISYDPPREIDDPTFNSAKLTEVLEADILTFHTPLTKHGIYPTYHWLDEEKLYGRSYECIINAARGGVTSESALLQAYSDGRIGAMITDVWENEPEFDPKMLDLSFIATPHIAGYSEQAKLTATKMICDELISFFKLPEVKTDLIRDTIDVKPSLTEGLSGLLKQLHPIMEYDKRLRTLKDKKKSKSEFRKLRTGLQFRYEYPNLRITEELSEQFPELKKLGIQSA